MSLNFNNGQPEARSHVDTVLSLYSEIACAGVPADCRPPILVTNAYPCWKILSSISSSPDGSVDRMGF